MLFLLKDFLLVYKNENLLPTKSEIKCVDGHSSHLQSVGRSYQKYSITMLDAFRKFPSQHKYNLSISFSRKIVWYRIAKVGSVTIYKLLRNHMELETDYSYWCHYPSRLYENFFHFAFVRNPWDRIVSCWLNKVVDSNLYDFDVETRKKYYDFPSFVNYVYNNIDVNSCIDPHLHNQHGMIDLNNIDYIGRFESFEADLKILLNRLQIHHGIIEKSNESKGRKAFQEYYDEDSIKKIEELYEMDIRLFNYTFQ